MVVKIAVVQQRCIPGRVEENRNKALLNAREALANGAAIVVFPEAMLVGYVAKAHALAEPVDGPTTRAFQSLLGGSTALVLYGLIERDADRYYNSAVLVGAENVVAIYRKTHLWWKSSGVRNETLLYEPGDQLVTFEVGGHHAGVLICYDGDFPEMTRTYATRSCEMIFWLNNRGSRSHEEVRPLAFGNSMIIAASNVCGPDEKGNLCRGGSNITSYDGSLLAEIWNDDGIIYAAVHPEQVADHRRANPRFTGRRPELYR